MLILGIDPGATGAAALIDARSGAAVLVEDLDADPSVTVQRLDSILVSGGVEGPRNFFAIVERAQSMPAERLDRKTGKVVRQGISSTATYMTGYGVLLGWLCARGIPYDTVHPSTWKCAMSLTKSKEETLAVARRLFPNIELSRKKDHNRAEALLLAEWARRKRFPRVNP
jgi:crossover junction endodeoxyribonuclease RuvC